MITPAAPAIASPFPAGARLQDRVLWLLQQYDRPLGAYQLAQKLTAASGYPHHPNSVYRVLQNLMQEGRVLPVATTNGWLAKRLAGPAPVFVLLCKECGNALQLPATNLEDDLVGSLAARRFLPRQVYLEVLGRCRSCDANRSADIESD